MKIKLIKNFICMLVVTMLISTLGIYPRFVEAKETSSYQIIVEKDAPDMQNYAAKELQKYLFQLFDEFVPIVNMSKNMDVSKSFILGTKDHNMLLAPIDKEINTIDKQGYVLKKINNTIYIGGYDNEGLLYGVYGLLDDHYGIGFYFSSDVIPEKKQDLYMVDVDEAKTPRQYMRGILPWTNFPQSATVYSIEDWKFIIDQMARMRMNFLNIHNYNGQNGHNEMFHNFTYNGITSRNWNATAKSGHGWSGPGWDVNEYRFGGDALFDDYDFGTDTTLHNDSLDNLEVFAKGYSQFQYIINYGHSRGVKLGLGLDIDLVMPDYGVAADASGLPEIQAETILKNYEDLDTLILYISEMIVNDPNALARWRNCFDRMYNTIRAKRPDMQIAVSGWGIKPETANYLPEDVVIAPISDYSSGFVNGSEMYPGHEFWAGPWAEKDFNSSVYFYPFNMELSDTINSYQQNKDTMQGMFTLSWRLSDAVDAKMMYIAKAPWDLENKYQNANDVYREYAKKCYGNKSLDDMTKLISEDEKQVVPTLWSECYATPEFTNANREVDIQKAQEMIDRVDQAILKETDQGCIARLQKLKNRLISAKTYCQLDQNFNSTSWENLQVDFSMWQQAFMQRVDDISTLGNVVSSQNRFVQLRYLQRETQLCNAQEIKAPANVVAKGTKDGAVLTWKYENGMAKGFDIYRNDKKINETMLSGDIREYKDVYDGKATYTIKAINNEDNESIASIPQNCDAGNSDKTTPQVIVISPTTSIQAGQKFTVKARTLDQRSYDSLSAVIHYRALGSDDEYKELKMERRVKGIFTAAIDTTEFKDSGIEYYISVYDGNNEGVYPVTASRLNAVCTVYDNENNTSSIKAPMEISESNGTIKWSDSENAFWYRIYRGDTPDFIPSPATLVTYVEKNTTEFKDVDIDFDGTKLTDKTKYYRVSAVDKYLNESIPSKAVEVKPNILDPLTTTLFTNADNLVNSRIASQNGSSSGSVVGFTQANGYAKFEQLQFSPTLGYNTVEISYSSDSNGSDLSVWIDAPSEELGGTLLGKANLGNTGSWDKFNKQVITLDTPIKGVHDVYFVYGSKSGYFYNLDTFRFGKQVSETVDGLEFTSNDMLVDRDINSTMKEEANAITNFGNTGDRIVLGKGIRAGSENSECGGGAMLVDLPGYAGLKCYGYISTLGAYFTFNNLPEGNVYLCYDKNYANPEHELAIYVNDKKEHNLSLPEATGSLWNDGIHKIMCANTGINVNEGDSVKFVYENVADSRPILNGIKLFVEQAYSGKQINITYSNNADTEYSLYLGDEKIEDIVLPNSNGQTSVYSKVIDIDNEVISLVAGDENILNNQNQMVTIYQIDILKEAMNTTKTVTVTSSQGGTISPNGVVDVEYGSNKTFEIIPDEGYRIESVLINDVDYGAISSYTFENLTYDATIDVKFVKKEINNVYNITVANLEHGKIIPSSSKGEDGQPIKLEIISDDNYRLKENSLIYISKSNPNGIKINEITKQFTMPSEDIVIYCEFEKIETNIDKTALKIALDLANAITDKDLENVVPVVVKEFNAALQEAKEILADETASQEDVNTSFNRLASVMQKLEFYKGDKTALKAFIDKVSGLDSIKYSTDTWAAFETKLNEAIAVYEDENAMQKEVNEAYTNLVTAFLNLRLIPDKSLLEDLINQANGLNSVNYTKASFDELTEALENAKATYDNPNALQVEVDNVKATLEKAIAGLQANSSAPVNNGNTTTSVKTGDNGLVGMFAGLVLLSVVGYAIFRNED